MDNIAKNDNSTAYFPQIHIEYGVFTIIFVAAIFGNFGPIPTYESNEYKIFIKNLNKVMKNLIPRNLMKQILGEFLARCKHNNIITR